MTTSATLLALCAIAIWSSLAYLVASLQHLPPLLLAGLALSIGGLIGSFRLRTWHVPLKTFAVGVGGIFGYHALLLTAFQLAPAVEVNLLNYLWPLLIVVLSPVWLPGYHLRLHHIVGTLLGLVGAGLIVTGGRLRLDVANLSGYLCATLAAFIWATYSLLTKRLPTFPSSAVGGFCLASGLAAMTLHFATRSAEQGPLLISASDWLHIVLLGAGPMGGAFYLWDAALKMGDPRVIGSLAYITPLSSTLLLTLPGSGRINIVSAAAMILIVAGAVISSGSILHTTRSTTDCANHSIS